MDHFSEWIRTLAACALLCAVALVVTPAGRVHRVTKTVCGLLMIIALISPLTGGDSESLSLDIAEYRAASREIAASAETENANLSRTIIEGELREYILDKAALAGAALTDAAVTMKWSDEGFWYPAGASLSGEVTPQQKREVSSLLESQLGIAPEDQKWSENEGD